MRFFLLWKESERYGKGWDRKRKRNKWREKKMRRKRCSPFIRVKRGDDQKTGSRSHLYWSQSISLYLLHSLFFRVKDFSGNGNVLAFNLSDKISISSLCFLPSLQFWAVWHLFCQCGWPKAFASLFPSLFLSHSCFQMGHSQLKSNGAAVQLTSKNCFLSCQVSKFHALEELHPAVKKSHHFLIVTSQLIFYNWFWCIYINGDWVCFPLFHWFACGLKRL